MRRCNIGKVFKKVAKVASFGLTDGGTGGALGGIVGGLTGQTAIDSAQSQQAQQARLQAELQAQQNVINANASALAANSTVDNVATVVSGGSADALGSPSDLKRKRTSSLSSVLGV